jgi:TET-associated glycosyltransferase-like protein
VPFPLRYPLYVISKGRSQRCLTARFLLRDAVPFKLVIEPQERELYAEEFGEERLITLPFSNLGKGSIPARNFVWEHAKASGVERHWILDDNIAGIWRRYNAKKYRCESSVAFHALEEFTDRYENVAIAGMNYYMFSINGQPAPPFWLNVHVYSCLLIRNNLPFRWRGKYNEDTDLCLQVLSAGWCTVLFNAFLIWKITSMQMKGGNTDQLYQGDGRLKMARALQRKWPHVVETKRRFRRPQHVIRGSWRGFDTPLKLKPGMSEKLNGAKADDFGMQMREYSREEKTCPATGSFKRSTEQSTS